MYTRTTLHGLKALQRTEERMTRGKSAAPLAVLNCFVVGAGRESRADAPQYFSFDFTAQVLPHIERVGNTILFWLFVVLFLA